MPLGDREGFDLRGEGDGAMDPIVAGKQVLIVEDEEALRAVLADALELSGAAPPTLCSSPDDAMQALARGHFDAAILDIALGRQDSYQVADELRRRRIPFAFTTAYDERPEAYRDVPNLHKPYNYDRLLRCVRTLCGGGARDGDPVEASGARLAPRETPGGVPG